MARNRIPTVPAGVTIRLAETRREFEAANRLVYQNYVEDGFWEPDETKLETNKYLHSAHRVLWVAMIHGELIGTMSVIRDSPQGLPSDAGQPVLMDRLRANGEMLAEVSCVATQRTRAARQIVLFLMAWGMQYCFHYEGLDRLVASCKPKHADFYESMLCFSKVSAPTFYDYSNAVGYLISLQLLEAHRLLAERYPANSADKESLYRFLLVDQHPSMQFPDTAGLRRSREADWLARAGGLPQLLPAAGSAQTKVAEAGGPARGCAVLVRREGNPQSIMI